MIGTNIFLLGNEDQFDIIHGRNFPYNYKQYPFDTASIMMYDEDSFTKTGLPTIKPRQDGANWGRNKCRLSETDKVKLANI